MSDVSDANPLARGKLGKKFFGAPLYMILLVVVGVVGWYWYKKRRASVDPLTQLATAVGSSEAASGNSASSGGSSSGGSVTTPNGTPSLTTNAQWSNQVANSLIADGTYSATDVSNALSKYLNGQQLTAQEQAIVNIALQRFSVPPEGILPVVTTPPQQTSRDIAKSVLDGIFGGNFTDQIARLNDPHSSVVVALNTWSSRLDSGMTPEAMKAAVLSGPTYQTWVHNNTANPTPAATPAPAPASAAPHNYTIQPGDTLSAIANRFYGAPDWQRIYAANSAVIGGNPNLIHPGQTITIPA